MPWSGNDRELHLQHFDEWMIRWKRYQSEEDWNIEKRCQERRQMNYGVSLGLMAFTWVYTSAPSTIHRWFSPPHYFDIGVDAAIKDMLRKSINGHKRYSPVGHMKFAVTFGVPFLYLAFMDHRSEGIREEDYAGAKTVFGEQFRRYRKTGKIEEFLPVNMKAPLPEDDLVVYGTTAEQ